MEPARQGRGAMPLLAVTDAARRRLEEMSARSGGGMLRISSGKKGCAGLSWEMSWAGAPGPGDDVVETDAGRIAVDRRSMLYVAGSRLDFTEGTTSSRLTLTGSPAIGGLCGCGESFRPCQ